MTKEANTDQTISGNSICKHGETQDSHRYSILSHAKSVFTRSIDDGSSTGLLANAMSPKYNNGSDDDDGNGDGDGDGDKNKEVLTSKRGESIRLPHRKVLSLPFLAAASPSFTKSAMHLAFGIMVSLYFMNQSRLLPTALSGVVSKVLFWPTLPITFCKRIGVWSTNVDDTVIIGGVPFFKFPEQLYAKYGVRHIHCDPSL